MRVEQQQAVERLLREVATDIRRLRRRTENEIDQWTIDRLSNNLDTIRLTLEPTAANLVNQNAPGDDTAVAEALRIVDGHSYSFRSLLGLDTAA